MERGQDLRKRAGKCCGNEQGRARMGANGTMEREEWREGMIGLREKKKGVRLRA